MELDSATEAGASDTRLNGFRVSHSGWLSKRNTRRFWVLAVNTLYWFASPPSMSPFLASSPRGQIQLDEAAVSIVPDRLCSFQIRTPLSNVVLRAPTDDDVVEWLLAISSSMQHHFRAQHSPPGRLLTDWLMIRQRRYFFVLTQTHVLWLDTATDPDSAAVGTIAIPTNQTEASSFSLVDKHKSNLFELQTYVLSAPFPHSDAPGLTLRSQFECYARQGQIKQWFGTSTLPPFSRGQENKQSAIEIGKSTCA